MICPRTIPVLCLCLLTALTSVSLAVARGAPQPVDRIVLCTGSGALSVAVDARGRPVGPPHHCPDCILAFCAEPPVQQDMASRVPARRADHPPETGQPAATGRFAAFTARAPPLAIRSRTL